MLAQFVFCFEKPYTTREGDRKANGTGSKRGESKVSQCTKNTAFSALSPDAQIAEI